MTNYEWLLSKVNYTGKGCLLWPFNPSQRYGKVQSVKGSLIVCQAHVVMCELVHGLAPTPEHVATHSCNVKRCINPNHLRWRTRSENTKEWVISGNFTSGLESKYRRN